jgi:hypothetical protein
MPADRLRWKRGLALLALECCFSVGLMHDWLAWNAARWEVGRRALARGIPSGDIEGGVEWDGWHSPYLVRKGFAEPVRGMVLPLTRDMFPHLTGRCTLTFAPPRGTVVLDREPYELWLLPGRRWFWLVEWRTEGRP